MVLAHDWIVAKRGGELVLEAIAHALAPDHDLTLLLTMVDRGVSLGPATDAVPRHASFLNALPESLRRWALPVYPAAVFSLSRTLAQHHLERTVDLVISTSSAAIKSLRPPTGVPHLCYCHAPARYIWSRRADYASGSSLADRARGLGLALATKPYRAWDRSTAPRVTRFLANSSAVAAQIGSAFSRDATVLHPPARTAFFTPDQSVARTNDWLIVSALEPYKRVDLAIRAAAIAKHPLRIVGEGSQRSSLEALARSLNAQVTFAGKLSDEGVRDAYRAARVMLYPQVEDFGITAVEALACGTPVVARAMGGALDTVTEETGGFFDHADPDALPQALADAAVRVASNPPSPDACRAQAMRFTDDRFRDQIRAQVRDLLARNASTDRD